MKHIIAALFMLLGTSLISSAQKHRLPVTVDSVQINSTFSYETIKYITLTIRNDSEEDYYFWISSYPTDDYPRMIWDYFYGRVNMEDDFTFGHLLYPDCLYHNGKYLVGFDFIKFLKPNDTFSVVIPYDTNMLKYYSERFAFVSKSELCNVIHDTIPTPALYTSSVIILNPILPEQNNEISDSANQWPPLNQLNNRGEKDGWWLEMNEDTRTYTNYKDGIKDGLEQMCKKIDGIWRQVHCGEYRDNEKVGKWRLYNPDGRTRTLVDSISPNSRYLNEAAKRGFKDPARTKQCYAKRYNISGRKEAEGWYIYDDMEVDTVRVGDWLIYRKDGETMHIHY